MKNKKALLLVNLGSPDSATPKAVRKYLNEFLMDKRVIDIPYLIRRFIVSAFVLPSRPKASAHAYQAIWWDGGSPLIVLSQRLKQCLEKGLDFPVSLAMRYGNPSIKNTLKELLKEEALEEIFLVPLYPHYAMSTTETVVEEVKSSLRSLRASVKLRVLPPFYEEPLYIQSLYESAREYLEREYDHLLFSFHGLPERHLRKRDPTRSHCLQVENCCEIASPAHQLCYRHQVFRTMEAFVKLSDLPRGKYSLTFQSRFGKDVWLSPFADQEIPRLAREGVKRLLVICPGFTTDCLETLEDVGIRGKESFLNEGGEEFHLIPCLNDHPTWVETLKKWALEGRGYEL